MSSRNYHLDALRGIAVVLVVIHHWTSFGSEIGLGNIGVQLFFALSGFLITRILLEMRDQRLVGTIGATQLLFSFHLSRAARIWPIALLVIGLVAVAGRRFAPPEQIIWHLTFASNILFFQLGAFESSLAHFWTLAVEQQYYLFWPFAVLWVPSKYLEILLAALIVGAPITRAAIYFNGMDHFAQYNVLPSANLDSIGGGAIIALWVRMPAQVAKGRLRGLGCFALLAAVAVFVNRWLGPLPADIEQTFLAVIFAWLIAWIVRGEAQSAVRAVLAWPPLVYVGTVSYGVYVYHVFIPRIVGAALRMAHLPELSQTDFVLLPISGFLTLALAGLSWLALERPILLWRRRLHLQMRPQIG